ncbi:MAG: hypothetical protein QM764_17625 [Chitinophagaceae bacterium]
MRIAPAPQGPLELSLDTNMMLGPKLEERHLHIECNGRGVNDVTYTKDEPSRHLTIRLPEGLVGSDGMLELRFIVDPMASPESAGVNDDERVLGVGLVKLSIAPGGAAHDPVDPDPNLSTRTAGTSAR